MFHLESILPITQDGQMNDTEDIRFAADMAIGLDIKIAIVIKVNFSDPKMHQVQQHGSIFQQPMFILVNHTKEYNLHSLLLKEGDNGLPVAMWFSNEPLAEIIVNPFYQHGDYSQKCDQQLLTQIMVEAEKLVVTKSLPSLEALIKAKDKLYFQ